MKLASYNSLGSSKKSRGLYYANKGSFSKLLKTGIEGVVRSIYLRLYDIAIECEHRARRRRKRY